MARQEDRKPERKYNIQIDRAHYQVNEEVLTGDQLRQVTSPPIGPERDLFQVIPGSDDLKVEGGTQVEMKSGLRFFTAPAHINPGQGRPHS